MQRGHHGTHPFLCGFLRMISNQGFEPVFSKSLAPLIFRIPYAICSHDENLARVNIRVEYSVDFYLHGMSW